MNGVKVKSKPQKTRRQVIRQAAKQFAGILACVPVQERMGWVVFALETLESLTPAHEKGAFLDELEGLAADVLTRIDTGTW